MGLGHSLGALVALTFATSHGLHRDRALWLRAVTSLTATLRPER